MTSPRSAAVRPALLGVGPALLGRAPALLCLGLGLLAAGFGAAEPAGAATRAVVDRVIRDSRIAESSGLAPSLSRPGLLWTHNDSGNSARIYAIGPTGGTIDAVKISGTLNRDWEAIAAFQDRSGRSMLALGDIGDNNEVHESAEIVVLAEPAAGQTKARPIALLHVRYPTGPANAEALMVAPTTGRIYLVTKDLLGARMFAVPAATWPGSDAGTATLEPVGTVPFGLVTDGTFLPDGRIVLRNYSSIVVLSGPGLPAGERLQVIASQDTPVQEQGESVALATGGTALMVGSEGSHQPVYRIALPVTVSPSLTGSAATSAASGNPAPTVAQARADGPGDGDRRAAGGSGRSSRLWALPLAAAGGTALAFAGAVAISRRQSRGRDRRPVTGGPS